MVKKRAGADDDSYESTDKFVFGGNLEMFIKSFHWPMHPLSSHCGEGLLPPTWNPTPAQFAECTAKSQAIPNLRVTSRGRLECLLDRGHCSPRCWQSLYKMEIIVKRWTQRKPTTMRCRITKRVPSKMLAKDWDILCEQINGECDISSQVAQLLRRCVSHSLQESEQQDSAGQ